MRWKELTDATGIKGGTLKSILDALAKKEMISLFDGQYSVVTPQLTTETGRSEGVIITPSKTDRPESGAPEIGRSQITQNSSDRPIDLPVKSVRLGTDAGRSIQVESHDSDLTDHATDGFPDEENYPETVVYLAEEFSPSEELPEMPEHFAEIEPDDGVIDASDIDPEDYPEDFGEPNEPDNADQGMTEPDTEDSAPF